MNHYFDIYSICLFYLFLFLLSCCLLFIVFSFERQINRYIIYGSKFFAVEISLILVY
jgi:hypothetical protein